MAVGRVHALVQALGDRHRPLGAEAELAARLLLEGAGRERRRRVALRGAGRERRRRPASGPRIAAACRSAVSPSPMSTALPSIRTSVRGERRPVGRREQRLERPVLAGRERPDLALALDDHAARRPTARGRPTGRRAPCARQERAQRVARRGGRRSGAPAARRRGRWSMSRGLANASRIAPSVISLKVTRRRLAWRDVGGLRDVPRDRLALAVEVGGEPDLVGAAGGLLDRGDLLARGRRGSRTRARSRGRRRRRTCPCRGSRAGRGRGRTRRGPGSPNRGSARSSAPWRATPRSRGAWAWRPGV